MTRRALSLAGVVLMLLVVASVSGAGVASAAAVAETTVGQKVYVEPSVFPGPVKVRPHEFLLTGDGTFSLYGLKYSSYGGATATATGHAYARGCTPDCAAGRVYRPKASVRLSKVKACKGKLTYTRLRYRLMGAIPKGLKRQGTYDLTPIGENGKPIC